MQLSACHRHKLLCFKDFSVVFVVHENLNLQTWKWKRSPQFWGFFFPNAKFSTASIMQICIIVLKHTDLLQMNYIQKKTQMQLKLQAEFRLLWQGSMEEDNFFDCVFLWGGSSNQFTRVCILSIATLSWYSLRHIAHFVPLMLEIPCVFHSFLFCILK